MNKAVSYIKKSVTHKHCIRTRTWFWFSNDLWHELALTIPTREIRPERKYCQCHTIIYLETALQIRISQILFAAEKSISRRGFDENEDVGVDHGGDLHSSFHQHGRQLHLHRLQLRHEARELSPIGRWLQWRRHRGKRRSRHCCCVAITGEKLDISLNHSLKAMTERKKWIVLNNLFMK